MKKELTFIIIGGLIVSSLLGIVLFKLSQSNSQAIENLGADKIKIEKVDIKPVFKKTRVENGKVLSKAKWNEKKVKVSKDIKKFFKTDLLGATDLPNAGTYKDEINEWFDVSIQEGCWQGVKAENGVTWELIESINIKLENNQC